MGVVFILQMLSFAALKDMVKRCNFTLSGHWAGGVFGWWVGELVIYAVTSAGNRSQNKGTLEGMLNFWSSMKYFDWYSYGVLLACTGREELAFAVLRLVG